MRRYKISSIDFNAYDERELEKMIFFASMALNSKRNQAATLDEAREILKKHKVSVEELIEVERQKREARNEQKRIASIRSGISC